MTRNYILDQDAARRKLQRMAYEVVENNMDEKEIILAGIKENGVVIATHVYRLLEQVTSMHVRCINISLDKRKPSKIALSEQLDFNDKVIIVVDDVANSGKTLLYAMKPFLEYHPRKIQAMVLVERTHKAFPIHPDYVGLSVATTLQEHIYVEVQNDLVTGAWME